MVSTRSTLDEIVESFSTLEDPRSHINRRHPLPSILVLAVLAVLAGAAGPTAIARWAKFKEDLLTGLLDLPHGIPGKDVFRRVLMMLKTEAFEAAFNAWIAASRRGGPRRESIADHRHPTAVGPPQTRRDARTSAPTSSRLGRGVGWPWAAGLVPRIQRDHAIPELLKKIDVGAASSRSTRWGPRRRSRGAIIGGQGRLRPGLKRKHESLHAAVIEHIDERLDGDRDGRS